MATVEAEITEFTHLEAEKVSGVTQPANGTPFLLLKAIDTEECSTCKGNGKILEGNRKCPDCQGTGTVAKSESHEADEFEDEVTKEWEGVYCGDYTCEACVIDEGGSTRLRPTVKALSDKDRDKMPNSAFAYVDPKGGKHLPIHDEGHVRAALGRFNQQDFSGADDPDNAKKAAAKKIVSAAKKHGIDVDAESTVGEAAKAAVGPGVPAGALDAPKASGQTDLSRSGVNGSVTAGHDRSLDNASEFLGGQTTAVIPLEQRVTTNTPAPPTTDGAGIAVSVAPLGKAIVGLTEAVEAVKVGQTFALPEGDAALTPGSMPWESYDAATLAQVAECLAGCCQALDTLAQRERTEGATADPADMSNAWDLEEAEQALEYALGVAARLSFHEAAAGQAAKAGRVLSGKNEQTLLAARDHLQAVLDGVQTKPASEADTKEEQDIMAALTKEDLAEAFASALKADREVRGDGETATKNANNDGDITEADLKPTKTAQANDITAIPDGGHVSPEYANKGAEEGEAAKSDELSLADLAKQIADQGALLQKIANRPRTGGPSLTGQPPMGVADLTPAAKSAEGELQRLEKTLADAPTRHARELAGEALTRKRLELFNAARGYPTGTPVGA